MCPGKKCLQLLSGLLVLVFLPSAGAFAQAFEATITGIIADSSGAVIPGVEIAVTNEETNLQSRTLSNDVGYYTIVALNPGFYRVEAELPDFRRYVQSNIRLEVNQVVRIDIAMEIGQIEQEILVVGEVPIINTANAARGSVIYNEEIIDLPLEGREFSDLSFLMGGVIPKEEGGLGSFANINGARADSMNFLLDGGNNNILRAGSPVVQPSLDSIREFKVQTSNYSAEYGRRSTGVINAVLKSGTNELHGSVFHFHRNDVFDSRSFFDLQDLDGDGKSDKSKLLRNNFGGNIGGPIIRDKMFFFFNYEGMRRRDGETRLGTVPTLEMREGIFPDIDPFRPGNRRIEVKDPLTGEQFEQNTIPMGRFHPISVGMLEFIPLPNIERGVFNHASNRVDADEWNDWTGKIDWQVNDTNNLGMRYIFNDRVDDEPFHGSDLGDFGRTGDVHKQLLGMTYTSNISPNVINQALFNFSRSDHDRLSPHGDTDFCGAFGIEGCTKNPEFFGFPRVDIQDFDTFGDANGTPTNWTENSYQFRDTLTVIKGAHNLRFGGEVIRTQLFELFQTSSRGNFRFRRRTNERTSHAFGDFLLGMLDQTERRVKTTKNYLFLTTFAGYLQDDWRISPTFTLNLGVRYDLFIPPHDKFGNWSNFDPALGKLVISGEPGSVEIPEEQQATSTFGGSNYPHSLIRSDRNNFAPRIGFAWRPFSDRTVIRAGFGQFFGLGIINNVRLNLGGNPPFTVLERHNRDRRNPLHLTWDSAFPGVTSLAGIATPNGHEINASSPNLFQYNLTVEHEIVRDTAVEIAYVGSKGTHLGRKINLNQQRFVTNPDGEPEAGRTYPDFGNINYFAFDADSTYNALQVGVRKRGGRINLRLNYVYSKSTDDSSRLSGGGGANSSTFPGVQDIFNRDAEHALSDFDRRHALIGSIVYRLPFPNHILTRGWQISSTVRLYSGTPVSPRNDQADTTLGEATRPDRIGDGNLANPTPERWFNLDDFPLVPEGSFRWGNAGRNVITGPSRKHWDLFIARTFQMPKEGHRLQFRWEVYNVPNFVNFRAVDERVNRGTAGTIERTYPARQMQVALKYLF